MDRSAAMGITLVLLLVCPSFGADQWLTLGGDFSHSGVAFRGPPDFSRPGWTAGVPDEYPLQGSSPAVWRDYVVVIGEIFENMIPVSHSLIAYDRSTGAFLWETPVDAPVFVNHNPTIDVDRQAVLVAADVNLYSLALSDGSVNWMTPLTRTTNASFAVLGARGYITDYDGPGSDASLYAVNLDPNDPGFEAGDIVWCKPIGGASGATPTIGDGRVYVGSTEGRVHAFDPVDGDPLWTTPMPDIGWEEGWAMETLTYRDGYVYGASYNFDTTNGEDNSHLVKLAADTGTLIWDVDSERSFAIPVVVGDRIYLTGGITDEFGGGLFGSVPKLMCFRDLGSSAVREWETELVGGTTFHLVYADGKLYAGRAKPFPLDTAYEELFIFDATKTPGAPGFVLDQISGMGAGPAIVDGVLYTIGEAGLFTFASPKPGDINLDDAVDLNDFTRIAGCFEGCDPENPPGTCTVEEFGRSDLNRDDCVNLADVLTFAQNFGL